MVKTVSILGCGWLGLPLGAKLVEKGYLVKGSVRREAEFDKLAKAGIKPFNLQVNADGVEGDKDHFFQCDVLVISLPPGRKNGEVPIFADKVKGIQAQIEKHNIPKVIFISSTSVYPNTNSIVHEEDAVNPDKLSGEVLIESEQILTRRKSYDLTIIRMAGLIGKDRNPVRFIEKGNDPKNANVPMNLIHSDDAVGVIICVLENQLYNEIFNACTGVHPTRQEFYRLAAKLTGNASPQFNNTAPESYKLVSNNKLITLSGYQFKYNNPLDYVTEIYGN